ncbi:TfoX/Sxy family protein [Thiorhodococcus fuscus]|uniref:TfoX/Sxy family protein n=1 Tax=Thiorhodococcus fuscus TaxID=527200 RepID=A0ABW4Y714_9GAMM
MPKEDVEYNLNNRTLRERDGSIGMASDLSFVAYVCDQLRAAGDVSFRKMFGEFALYHAGKVVALICDNQLFVKPTAAGRAILGEPEESPPYPGAKPHFLVTDRLDDAESLVEVVLATSRELPEPKPKKPRKKRSIR